jgi:PKD repeat protein
MSLKIKVTSFILFLILSAPSDAQNFEWLRTVKSKNNGTYLNCLSTMSNGGSAIIIPIYNDIASVSPDTFFLDTFRFTLPNFYGKSLYLTLLDSNGKATKAKEVAKFWFNIHGGESYSGINDICQDDSGNFYFVGYLGDSINIVNSDTLKTSKGRILFAKLDKNLNFIWTTQIGNSKAIGFHFNRDIGNTSLLYSEGHLFFTCITEGSAKIGTTNYTFNDGFTTVFGELNLANGGILWSNYLFSPASNNPFQITGLVSLNKKIYISGDFGNGLGKGVHRIAVIGSDTLFGPGGFIIETDSIGKYIKKFTLYNDNFFGLRCLTTDGKHLYFGGFFRDSLPWGNKKIIPEFPSNGWRGNKYFELYAASITTSFKPRWFFRPKILDNTLVNSGTLKHVKFIDGFLYFGGDLYNIIVINSNILSPPATFWTGTFLMKSDNLGNILWANCGGGGFLWAMGAGTNSVFAGGLFRDTIQFGKYKDTLKPKLAGAFFTKITDYSITRGKVSSGPYCAGDTIKVPYKLVGSFDTSNQFIAELSNEQGNFEGGGRELGRLKTNKEGTVRGLLPDFKISTSANYRIRIRSTSPAIQSYYVTDTLRLLIYSRDKANPGLPETICMGDSIKLNTFGGTKWTWSPKYRMDDSTKRQPWAWPIRDTIYKIIIADSSGCGEPDTAFKKIIVRVYPKARLAFKDTVICDNSNIKVPVLFEGGDSNYTWRWYFVASPKLWFPSNSGNGKFSDTFSFSPTVIKVAIILKDGCTAKADTAFLTISQRKPVTITTTYRDTTLCNGNLLNYKATATGGIPKQYRYQWKDLATNFILSTTDSLKILTKKTLKIQLIVNDGCEALGDTAEFEVKVRAELKALTNLRDTTICEGKSLNYKAQAMGGDSKTYTYSWVLNGKEISTSNILNLTSNFLNLTSNLSLITTDNCSPNDTITKSITVIPSPKADFTWDLACSRTVTKFQFTGTKPSSPITTSFHWNFNNEATSTLENPSHQFAKSGTSTLTLTSNNGCTDTMSKKMEIKVQAKAEFEVKDVCENQTALFINQSQDATGYLWKFGDGQTSQQENPKHNYTISTTTTYNVTLVAQVSGGCADSVSKALTINQNPSSDFSYTYNGSKVDLKIAKGGNSYQWKFGTTDSVKTTATTYTHTIKSSDQHTVCLTATDLSGCSSQTCKNITVGILKLTEKSFKIFPNPNNGSFTIELDNPEMDAAIEVFDLMGKLVKKLERVEKVTLVDLEVASGIYLVKVKTGGVVWNKKILVSFGVDTNR